MSLRIFVAGAAGVIGRRLVPLLQEAGHRVAGTTRSVSSAADLRSQGIAPVVVDVFDAAGLAREVAAFRPDIVIHQLTDLPDGLDPARMNEALARNARIRDEGTRNLVRAAIGAGARRVIAQSIAWAYAPGREPHVEDDPLDLTAQGDRAVSVGGVAALERWVQGSPPLEGIVLRYGHFYGPGTGAHAPSASAAVHVDAAAQATVLAIATRVTGIFNVAETDAYVSSAKAVAELGWDSSFRLPEQPDRWPR